MRFVRLGASFSSTRVIGEICDDPYPRLMSAWAARRTYSA